MKDVIIENEQLKLTIGADGITKSLICKASNEECLAAGEEIAIFSVTHTRPFNNEVKLAHPNKKTTYQANSVTREGDKLIVGFEVILDQAIIEIKETPAYIAFTFVDFIIPPGAYGDYLRMTPPPAAEMRFLQLPIRNRANFGEWMNVSWDEKAAVNVMATIPFTRIDSERRKGYRVMYADAVKGIKLKGASAALTVSTADKFLDNIAQLEEDYNLPRGVESRRSDFINASYYWSGNVTPANVDEHIGYAKMGGFRMMLMYYTCFFKEHGYGLNGNYDYRDDYPNGKADLKIVLDKIKAAGITPGVHFLQTHIGLSSRYVTPVTDHRLGVTTLFTLAKPFNKDDDVIYTEQNPEGSVMDDKCRVLRVGGELVTYKGYTTEPPYCFTGIEHGAYKTNVGDSYPAGLVIGIMDISEFGASSTYIDQNSDLQDEIADKIADFFNVGFRFVYFDGSEGANIPYEIYVPLAQYRVYKKLSPAPLFTEGAAKAHFSWHFLSGGNAFDVFGPEIFKEKIKEFPCEEAPRMRQDFTRLNFGWWGYWAPGASPVGTQPDMLEFGTSRAAAWDCPVAFMENRDAFAKHPRNADNLEVMRRWEDVRAQKWLTDAQKLALQNLEQEHILLINENDGYELAAYDEISNADKNIRAFAFERNDGNYVVYWHATGSGNLELNLDSKDFVLMEQLGKPIDNSTVPICNRRYMKTNLPKAKLIEAFENAKII